MESWQVQPADPTPTSPHALPRSHAPRPPAMAAMPMPTPRSLLLLLLLATPFLLLPLAASAAAPTSNPDIDLEYLIKNAGLDDDAPSTPDDDPEDGATDFPGLDADYDEEDLFGDDDGPEESSHSHPSAADEAHVLLLTAANFTAVLAARRHVMVEFYAPWCGHCRALAPHYAAAATHLAEQGVDVALAKVDATEEHELAQAHGVQGYPTLLFFIDGVPRDYAGERTKDAIVAWIGKKLGPAVQNLTTVDEAEKVVTGDDVAVLAYLDHLSGVHSNELAAASRLEDTVSFYQTTSPDLAKLFHIDPEAKRPSVVLLKKEEEKLTVFDNFRGGPDSGRDVQVPQEACRHPFQAQAPGLVSGTDRQRRGPRLDHRQREELRLEPEGRVVGDYLRH
ncbi:protein disulfide isomerase-like 1-4 [Triticum aestivum]|nr:protein disulfide isomerase-like 1-4 [Triticum aestivum]